MLDTHMLGCVLWVHGNCSLTDSMCENRSWTESSTDREHTQETLNQSSCSERMLQPITVLPVRIGDLDYFRHHHG